MRKSNTGRKWLLASVAIVAAFAVSGFASPSEADAGWGFSFGYRGGYGYNGPVYHAPSLHYDRVYHHDYNHWTPRRGWHSHGHYHMVPHYVPGHFDYQHGNHLHLNRRFH